MGVDINAEVMRAGDIMARFRMPREVQIEVVRILMAAGVEAVKLIQTVKQARDDTSEVGCD